MQTSLASDRDRDTLKSFARRIDPSDAGAHNNLGVLYYNKGLYEEAVSAFMRALELDAKMLVAQRNLEIAYFNTGYYDKRVGELSERLRVRPDDRDTRWDLGRTFALLGQSADAVAEFTELLRHHPSDIGALVQLFFVAVTVATPIISAPVRFEANVHPGMLPVMPLPLARPRAAEFVTFQT